MLRPRYSDSDPDDDAIRLLELMPAHDADEVCEAHKREIRRRLCSL